MNSYFSSFRKRTNILTDGSQTFDVVFGLSIDGKSHELELNCSDEDNCNDLVIELSQCNIDELDEEENRH